MHPDEMTPPIDHNSTQWMNLEKERDRYQLATIFLAIIMIIFVILFVSTWPHVAPTMRNDDTDPPKGVSGMDLYQDNRTGCQYLSLPGTSLIPRMDRDGKQVCN